MHERQTNRLSLFLKKGSNDRSKSLLDLSLDREADGKRRSERLCGGVHTQYVALCRGAEVVRNYSSANDPVSLDGETDSAKHTCGFENLSSASASVDWW